MAQQDVVFDGNTDQNHYRVVDTIYSGRPARVLYSGDYHAAQSGVAKDDGDDLLFDYNQRFLELVRGLNLKSALLIGGGAFTLPKAISDEFPALALDVVEVDRGLLDIARDHFGFEPSEHVRVLIDDGYHFLQNNTHKYDLIMIDAFIHAEIPQELQTIEAANLLRHALNPEGVVGINTIASYHGVRSTVLRRQIAALQTTFTKLELYPASRSQSLWIPQNFILTAQNAARPLENYLRYQPIRILKVDRTEAVA